MWSTFILAFITQEEMSNKKKLFHSVLKIKSTSVTPILNQFDEVEILLTFDPWNQFSFRGSECARHFISQSVPARYHGF